MKFDTVFEKKRLFSFPDTILLNMIVFQPVSEKGRNYSVYTKKGGGWGRTGTCRDLVQKINLTHSFWNDPFLFVGLARRHSFLIWNDWTFIISLSEQPSTNSDFSCGRNIDDRNGSESRGGKDC